VGGLSGTLSITGSLVLLAALPVLGLLALVPHLRRAPQPDLAD
jgi:hypothetical protein